jgi:hypothetical protein
MAVGSKRAKDRGRRVASQACLKLRLADTAVAEKHHVDKRTARQAVLEGFGGLEVDP